MNWIKLDNESPDETEHTLHTTNPNTQGLKVKKKTRI